MRASSKKFTADRALTMAAQMLAAEQGISGIDALVKLIKSPVYDAIYDLETGMWREGPSSILEAYQAHPNLVAKDFYRHGCYAMPVEHGPELVELKHDLQAATSLEHLQLVTISRPAAYGEYAPYTIVKDREEFIRLVLQMKPCQASDEDVKKISEQLIEKNRTAYETLAK